MTPDKFHGQGGTFKVNSRGERERVGEEVKPHPDGDRARDADGKPFDTLEATTPALPKPGTPPWATEATAPADAKADKKKGS